jgi:hypothetical protein
MALRSIWPLKEMSARNLLGGKARPAHNVDINANCEPRCLTTLRDSTAFYRDSFTLPASVTLTDSLILVLFRKIINRCLS